MDFAKERAVAIEAVSLACSLTLKVFHRLVQGEVLTKDDKTPVTIADLSSQALISLILKDNFPSYDLVGEEDADDLRASGEAAQRLRERVIGLVDESLSEAKLATRSEEDILDAIDRGASGQGGMGRFWTCDPIDGTKGFVRGDQYAVCLALLDGGRPVVAVVGCPNLMLDPNNPASEKGALFVAVKGGGAFMHPLSDLSQSKRLEIPPLSSSRSLIESWDAAHSDHVLSKLTATKLGITAPPIRMDSQAKYCSLLLGHASLFFRVRLPRDKIFKEKIWDHAPGALLVTEAGGRCTDLDGRELTFGEGRTFESGGIWACEAGSLEIVLSGVRAALAEEAGEVQKNV